VDVTWLGFVERIRLWTHAATAEHWDFTVDALRLLRHVCRQHGPGWRELAQGSISMAAAARLPLVTSWAVRAAELQMTGRLARSEPGEWCVAPRRWPSPEVAELLAELRAEHAAELASEGHAKDPDWVRPTRIAHERSARKPRGGRIGKPPARAHGRVARHPSLERTGPHVQDDSK
jgi:hypothetical protein